MQLLIKPHILSATPISSALELFLQAPCDLARNQIIDPPAERG
jgi:hypothetical protein